MQVPSDSQSRLTGHALQTLSIPGAFALGAAQMADRRVIRVLVKSALVSLVLLALVTFAARETLLQKVFAS